MSFLDEIEKEDDGIIITEEYQSGIDFLNENKSGFLFLTGEAGTGKSTFLKVVEKKVNKRMIKVAPTGIAALNIKGETIHTFFKLPTTMFPHISFHIEVSKKLKGVQMIVIDEISMVRADLLDTLDQSLREHTKKDEPFGGLMVLAIGDLYQLPPVLTKGEDDMFYKAYSSPYFFAANIFKEVEILTLQLKQIFRQKDQKFINLLNSLRKGDIKQSTINEINSKIVLNRIPEHFDGVILCTINKSADGINSLNLEKLESELVSYTGAIKNEVDVRSLPVPLRLDLKMGAKVLLCRNATGYYVNGDTGEIVDFGEDDEGNAYVLVKKKDGVKVRVFRSTWEFFKYEEGGTPIQVGSYTQFPIKLGWAITVHKSQGMTIHDEVVIDTGYGCFAAGQFYVAASRITDPSNMKLLRPLNMKDVIVSQTVKAFMES